jgi:hypothetical protein
MNKHKRKVHTAILKAAANGTGILLSADEVFDLANDSAVIEAGLNCLHYDVRLRIERQKPHGYLNPEGWKGVRP